MDSRLHPSCSTRDAYLLVFIAKLNLAAISAVILVFYRHLKNTRYNIGPLRENMTSSTKPEVYNAVRGGPSQGHRRHAQKFGEVRPCGFRVTLAYRQTDI